MRRLFLLVVAAGAGAFALERYGRARVRAELAPLGASDAAAVSASLSFAEAAASGARALSGGAAYERVN